MITIVGKGCDFVDEEHGVEILCCIPPGEPRTGVMLFGHDNDYHFGCGDTFWMGIIEHVRSLVIRV